MNYGRIVFVVLVAAIVLLIALSWSSFAEFLVDRLFSGPERIWGQLAYAVVVTVVGLVLVMVLATFFKVDDRSVERLVFRGTGV